MEMHAQCLKGKVGIITGAARGIGEGIAKVMARNGAIVVLFSRDILRIKKHEREISRLGQAALSFEVDVTDAARVDQVVQQVVRQFGKVDILVNNAGIFPSMPFVEMSDNIRDTVIDVNIKGVWNCTKAVIPSMLKQRYGKIINISSVTGPMVSDKGTTIYSATKGAVSGFTRALALEMAEHGINVNAICPGDVDTPGVREAAISKTWDADEYIKKVSGEIPLGRLCSIEEIGEVVVFLASEKSKYITGTEIVIDGGNIIQEHK